MPQDGFRSDHFSIDMQCKRAKVIEENWPLHHDADRSTWRHVVFSHDQHAQAADVHYPARTFYVLPSIDGVTGTKRNRKANSAATFLEIEGTPDFAFLGSYVEHQDELSIVARYIFHGSRTRNADLIGANHHAGVQGNLLSHFNVDPPARDIDAPSRQASNMSAFVKPRQPDWFARWDAPILALEFRHKRLYPRASLAPRA